ncbi:hypothetical protein PGTUg99_018018 [Puccinia graminis f. sp. tritici]|uniref:Uncharacterized protein n=1 Tax=Puccinia graminis f. sp. tritici TaxID=56615 RepID=A0A5B0Q8H7_PUCGR|nr:hypothetical protein PGTUg99_018018 [Puccinia graminis f. sp. tritici]
MSHFKGQQDLDLDDMLPNLPFSNGEESSQKSYLGTPDAGRVPLKTQLTTNLAHSQPPPTSLRGMKISHKNPSTKTQLEAAGVLKKPASKVTIKLLMDDPGTKVKKKEKEKSQDNILAMLYAPNDKCLALHRFQAWAVLNVVESS